MVQNDWSIEHRLEEGKWQAQGPVRRQFGLNRRKCWLESNDGWEAEAKRKGPELFPANKTWQLRRHTGGGQRSQV